MGGRDFGWSKRGEVHFLLIAGYAIAAIEDAESHYYIHIIDGRKMRRQRIQLSALSRITEVPSA